MAYLDPVAGTAREGLNASGLSVAESAELNTLVTAIPQAAVATVAGATPAGGTGATAGAYDTSANRDILIATVAELKAQVNSLLAKLRTAGIITP